MRRPAPPAAVRWRRARSPRSSAPRRRLECAATCAASRAYGARRGRTRMQKRPSPLHRRLRRLSEAQARHQPHRLGGYAPGHLALPTLAVTEDDRPLDPAKTRLHGTVGELDLEGIALGAHAVEAVSLTRFPK